MFYHAHRLAETDDCPCYSALREFLRNDPHAGDGTPWTYPNMVLEAQTDPRHIVLHGVIYSVPENRLRFTRRWIRAARFFLLEVERHLGVTITTRGRFIRDNHTLFFLQPQYSLKSYTGTVSHVLTTNTHSLMHTPLTSRRIRHDQSSVSHAP